MTLSLEFLKHLTEELAFGYELIGDEDRPLIVHADGIRVSQPPAEPEAETLFVHSLDALADFIKGLPGEEVEGAFVHVEGPDVVRLVGPLKGRHRQREVLVAANLAYDPFVFDQWHDLESFRIQLLSMFDQHFGSAEALIELCSQIKKGHEITDSDDGTTQRVTVRSGLELVDRETVPNPVRLAPFRTFPEIDPQPASPFVLRFREQPQTGGIAAALFESDAGRWRLDALKDIADYLAENQLPVPIIA